MEDEPFHIRDGVLLAFGTYDHPCGGPDTLVETARMAETAGFDGVIVSEHVVMGEHTERYPWGRFPGRSDAPWLDPLVALPMVGAVTSRLKLCTGILIVPLRPAAVLAKAAATIDRMTGGRLELGIGTGWQREEFQAAGVTYETRGRAMTDTVAACRALWAPGAASFSSPTVSFDRIWCEPKPATPGGPRVLFSGTLTERNVRRIVDHGDGWIPIMGESVDGVIAGIALLRKRLDAAGRDPAHLIVRGHLPLVRDNDGRPLLGPTVEQAPRLWASGVTDVVVPLSVFVREVTERDEWFELAATMLAGLR
jgi:probable F420-dependent oxidoreductase